MNERREHWIQSGREFRACDPADQAAVEAQFLNDLRQGLPGSVAMLSELQGGGPLEAYSLCVDADLLSVLAAGFTASAREKFRDPSYAWSPAEWKMLGGPDTPLSDASALLSCLSYSFYQQEDDSIEPDDDHRRPWKQRLFGEMVGVLHTARESGLFAPSCFLVVQYPDGGPTMSGWILDGVRKLNSPDQCRQWETE